MTQQHSYILGVDIGTSSSKALAFSVKGKVLAQHQIKYNTRHPHPDYSEQDPETLLAAVTGVIRTVVEQIGIQPMCVSFSSAMHSLMAVDGKGNPLSPLILWSDNRSLKAATAFKHESDALDFYHHTGTPIHPMSPFCKLLWWKAHAPETFREADRFISIKEYVFSRFFGRYLVDYSMASATGLFDHRSLQWYAPALQRLELPVEKLSEPVAPTHQCKGLRSPYARQTGLDPAVPFVMGAGDGCLANLGTGVTQPGELAVTIGTSGAVRLFGTQPIADPQGRIFNYLLQEGQYISGGAINNGGVLLDWYRRHFIQDPERSYDAVVTEAHDAPAGCDGLLFLPYLFGERAPMWDARARGAFIGISNRHERPHFARALLEGIGYALYHSLGIMEELTGTVGPVYASGGFTRSPKWVQLLTDIFAKEVRVSGHGDASSVGAAMMGMKAMGVITDWAAAEKHLPLRRTYQPAAPQTAMYHRNFALYAQLYTLLEPAMHTLAGWQSHKK